jgi:rhomboid protease GluP
MAGLIANLPTPRYLWSEEERARREIVSFLDEDARISAQWGSLLNQASRDRVTFDQLAGRIEDQVAAQYADSFEQLARVQVSPAIPSAPTLTALREYAELRRDASRDLVEGLRAHDPERIRESLEKARQAVPQADSRKPRKPETPARQP